MELGGHLRAAEGLKFVPLEARALDYRLVQIMLSEELDWNPLRIDETGAMEYRKTMFGVKTYVHLPFTINPCEDAPRRRQFGRVTFRKFAKAAQCLGASGLVLHPGFRKELSEEDAFLNFVLFFEGLVDDDTGMEILIETDSGSKNGSKVGSPEFIARAIKAVRGIRLGMCVDTAHLYARGIDMWDPDVAQALLDIYRPIIKLIHLNVPDADVTLGGNRDRHNSAFQDFGRDSVALIKACADWPCILERRSLAVQEMDAKFIRSVLG